MPTIDTQVWLALKSRIDTLATSPALPSFDPGAIVSLPTDEFGPAPFLLISDLRNEKQRLSIGTKIHRLSGTLMLSVQWPITRTVTHAQLVQIAGTIAEHFTADTRMQYEELCLRVTRDADAAQPFRDADYHVAMVRAPWEVLRLN